MNNILLELEKEKVEHFIMRSYLTCSFSDEVRNQYHVYFLRTKKNSKDYKLDKDYDFLKHKKLQKIEIAHFENSGKYKLDFNCEHGSIFIHKEIGFKKERNPRQTSLWG